MLRIVNKIARKSFTAKDTKDTKDAKAAERVCLFTPSRCFGDT